MILLFFDPACWQHFLHDYSSSYSIYLSDVVENDTQFLDSDAVYAVVWKRGIVVISVVVAVVLSHNAQTLPSP